MRGTVRLVTGVLMCSLALPVWASLAEDASTMRIPVANLRSQVEPVAPWDWRRRKRKTRK